jgi:hypothetical protein
MTIVDIRHALGSRSDPYSETDNKAINPSLLKSKNKNQAPPGVREQDIKSAKSEPRSLQQLTRIPDFQGKLNIMATYDSLHRQCRTLESLFDAKLTSYSRLASTISRNDSDVEASGSGERWKDLQNEVEDLLENVCFFLLIVLSLCISANLLTFCLAHTAERIERPALGSFK